jgi:hypothetical protein
MVATCCLTFLVGHQTSTVHCTAAVPVSTKSLSQRKINSHLRLELSHHLNNLRGVILAVCGIELVGYFPCFIPKKTVLVSIRGSYGPSAVQNFGLPD